MRVRYISRVVGVLGVQRFFVGAGLSAIIFSRFFF